MSQQLSLATSALPDLFVDAFRSLERAAHVREEPLAAGECLLDRFGAWWLEVRTTRGRFALMNRTDLEVAARDLFTLVHETRGATR
jgi:hypothetical protein